MLLVQRALTRARLPRHTFFFSPLHRSITSTAPLSNKFGDLGITAEAVVNGLRADLNLPPAPVPGWKEPAEPTNLLITLDALDTLYEVRGMAGLEVGVQYMKMARKHGLREFKYRNLQTHFRKAFKEMSEAHPNYGYGTDMTPKQWWDQLARKMFSAAAAEKPQDPDHPFTYPASLSDALWDRFSSKEAYAILPSTLAFLWVIHDLKKLARLTRRGERDWKFRTITVGVVSNSDARVIHVLQSMDITVDREVINTDGEVSNVKRMQKARSKSSAVRRLFKKVNITREELTENQSIDFVATSCKVGTMKPGKEIFEAARKTAHRMVSLKCGEKEADKPWEWYHIGDSVTEDVEGAVGAGAVAILFDKNKKVGETEKVVQASKKGESYKVMVVSDLREVAEMTEGLSVLYQAGRQRVDQSGYRGDRSL